MLNNKSLQSVAEAVKKVWSEELTDKQKKIDKNHNGKIDSQDLQTLRKEGWDDMLKSVKDAKKPQPNGGSGVKQGTAYGGGKQKEEKPVKESEQLEEKMSDAQKTAVKSVNAAKYGKQTPTTTQTKQTIKFVKDVKEESSQEEFTAELKKAQAKAAGKVKQPEVAKPAVQAVQQEETHTTIQVIDLTDANGVKTETIELDERELTPAETETKEHNVKAMKKNLQGFKDRYGARAKEVMYATATKQAKGE